MVSLLYLYDMEKNTNTWDNLFSSFGYKRVKISYNCRFYYNKEKDVYGKVDELLHFVEVGDTQLPYSVQELLNYLTNNWYAKLVLKLH